MSNKSYEKPLNEDQILNDEIHDEKIENIEDLKLKFEEEIKKEKENFLLIIANYQNKMNRMQIDTQNSIAKSIERIIIELTPLIDDLNSAKNNATKEIQDGIDLIIKNLKKILINNGIVEIEPKEGDSFNLEMHQAIASNIADFENAKIKTVVKNGYKFGTRIISPAFVIVE